jgi:hypothetical protein
MSLEEILTKQKDAILRRWYHAIAETYPAETARFIIREKNPFANPVGSTVHKGIEGVYQELLQGMDSDKISPHLDKIIRIRATQDFSPADAIGFIFSLKRLIREELEEEISQNLISSEELLVWDARIDALALLAFNIYSECREKIYEIRVNEIKNRTHRLLQRANLIMADPE